MPSSNDPQKRDCNQYYEILCKLIEDIFINQDINDNLSAPSTEDLFNFDEIFK